MKVVYQTFLTILILYPLSCSPITSRGITPKSKIEIACFDVMLTSGVKYDVFLINFVLTGDVWVWWVKDSKGMLGFFPVFRHILAIHLRILSPIMRWFITILLR